MTRIDQITVRIDRYGALWVTIMILGAQVKIMSGSVHYTSSGASANLLEPCGFLPFSLGLSSTFTPACFRPSSFY